MAYLRLGGTQCDVLQVESIIELKRGDTIQLMIGTYMMRRVTVVFESPGVLVGFLLRDRPHMGDLEATGFIDNYCVGGNSPPALPYTKKINDFLGRLILLVG